MLILCKQCHTVIFDIIDNMYNPKCITNTKRWQIKYNYFTDVRCCLCKYHVGFNTTTVCEECLIKNYNSKKKLIFFYINSVGQYGHHCSFCLNVIHKLLFLDSELIEFKNL